MAAKYTFITIRRIRRKVIVLAQAKNVNWKPAFDKINIDGATYIYNFDANCVQPVQK